MNKYNGKIEGAEGKREKAITTTKDLEKITKAVVIVAGAIATMTGVMLNLLEEK